MTMETKDIAVNGQVFPCPLSWTVEQALEGIRSEHVIQGGGIRNDGVPVLGTARIRDLAGPLTFVGGRPIQQLGATYAGASAGDNSVESGAVTKRFEIRCDLALVKRTFGARMLHYGLVGTISRKTVPNVKRQIFYTEIVATGTQQNIFNFQKGLPFILKQLGVENSPAIQVSSVDLLNNHNDVRILKTEEAFERVGSSGFEEKVIDEEVVMSLGSEKSKSHSTASYVNFVLQAAQNYFHHMTGIVEENRTTETRIFIREEGRDSSAPTRPPFAYKISSETKTFDFLGDLFPGKTIISYKLQTTDFCASVAIPSELCNNDILVVETN